MKYISLVFAALLFSSPAYADLDVEYTEIKNKELKETIIMSINHSLEDSGLEDFCLTGANKNDELKPMAGSFYVNGYRRRILENVNGGQPLYKITYKYESIDDNNPSKGTSFSDEVNVFTNAQNNLVTKVTRDTYTDNWKKVRDHNKGTLKEPDYIIKKKVLKYETIYTVCSLIEMERAIKEGK